VVPTAVQLNSDPDYTGKRVTIAFSIPVIPVLSRTEFKYRSEQESVLQRNNDATQNAEEWR